MTQAKKKPLPVKGHRQGHMDEVHEDISNIPQIRSDCKGVT